MKSFIKWFGIIALVAVIGFSFVACDNDSNGDNNSSENTGGNNPGGNNPGGGNPVNPFIGTWNRIGTGGQVITFNSNGTAYANWMGNGTYTYSGNNTAVVKFGSVTRTITISGNSFTWETGVSFSKQ